MATPEDLAETVKEVEALDRRIVATQADVRDYAALKAALDDGVAQLGHLDIVSANAGIFSFGTLDELSETDWQDMIDVNLTGVWHTAKAAIPHLRAAGGGSIILTSSAAGLKGMPNVGHYVTAKHGVVGLMRTLALELAPDMIRVNSVHPTTVNTDMIQNAATYELFASGPARGRAHPGGRERAVPVASTRCRSRGSSRSTSPTRCSCWPPTRRATSPASRCPSTRASCSSNEFIHEKENQWRDE